MKKFQALLSFLLVLLLCLPVSAEVDFKALLNEAMSAETFEEQVELIEQATLSCGEDAQSLLSCGQMLLLLDEEMQETELCESIFLKAYQIASDDALRASALDTLINFYVYTANPDAAYQLLSEAALSSSTPADYYNTSAALHLYYGDLAGAYEMTDLALAADPTHHDTLITKATLLLAEYDYEGSLAVYDDILTRSPSATDALYGKYGTLVSSGNFKKASRTMDELISLTQDDTLWLERANLTLWKRYMPEDALQEAQALLNMNPNWVEAVTVKVGSLLMLERYDEAIEATSGYEASAPEQAKLMRALASLDSSRYDEAIEILDELLALPEVLPIYNTYRAIAQYYAHDDGPAALAYLTEAANQGASDYSFFLNLGHVQRRLGNYEEAARSYTLAAITSMEDPTAEYYLTLLYAEAGKTDLMLSTLETMEKHYPGWYETLTMRMIVEDLLGNSETALEVFLTMEDKFPFPSEGLWSSKVVLLAATGDEEAARALMADEEKISTAECTDWSNLAMAHLFLEDYDAAQEALTTARAALGDDASASTRIDRVNLETTCALLKLKTGDVEGCAAHLETAAQSGWQPAHLLHWAGFEDFIQTDAFALLMETYDTVSAPWDLTQMPTLLSAE